jgi:hypothetical protein
MSSGNLGVGTVLLLFGTEGIIASMSWFEKFTITWFGALTVVLSVLFLGGFLFYKGIKESP